jgi:putative membrane protein
MFVLLFQWLLYAIALMVVSRIVPGFVVTGLWPALIASLVIGLLNATIGFFLKIVTFPFIIITLGLFLLVINALMILLASSIVRGFHVRGFVPAFWGAVVLALLGMLIKALTKSDA